MKLTHVSAICLVVLLAACSRPNQPNAIGSQSVTQFRSSPTALSSFQSSNGKIGVYALPVFAALASQYLDLTYAEAEDRLLMDYEWQQITFGQNINLKTGWNGLTIVDPASGEQRYFGDVTIQNVDNERAVILLEAIDEGGKSLGVSYVHLEPGDTYYYKHNVAPLIILAGALGKKAAVAFIVGGVAVGAGAAGAEADASLAAVQINACALARPQVARDYCTGSCTAPGVVCVETAPAPYGPQVFGRGMSQAGACNVGC